MEQQFINLLIAALGAALGWLVKVLWDAVTDLRADMKQIERDLPEVYVRKDDFRSAVTDIKDDMKEIKQDMKEGFTKIDKMLGSYITHLEKKEDRRNGKEI
jgi:Tfp pilus assembly protein PilO